MSKTVEFYLNKGFDRKSAEYFASGRKKLVGVQPNDDFTLTLTFDNDNSNSKCDKIYRKKNTF